MQSSLLDKLKEYYDLFKDGPTEEVQDFSNWLRDVETEYLRELLERRRNYNVNLYMGSDGQTYMERALRDHIQDNSTSTSEITFTSNNNESRDPLF